MNLDSFLKAFKKSGNDNSCLRQFSEVSLARKSWKKSKVFGFW
jgi:hypothetical protein